MAGIVASTLRRKAFHKKLPVDNRYQIVETHISQSPESHGSPSSPGFKARIGAARAPKGAKLCHEDFWPSCTNTSANNDINGAHFETFDTLIPRANGWLQNNLDIYLIKCETVEKKVTCIDDVTNDSCMFLPKNHHAAYVKGLRLWYVNVTGTRKLALESMAPSEIGYMNVIPKCIDASGKYPKYEHLPETYAAINAYLAGAPLEGKIVTIETVPLKLPRKQWKSFEINPDETYFPDEYLRHVLNITRIYFRYGEPEVELIGAQDFLPDFEGSSHWPPLHHSTPRYGPISTAINKVKDWIQNTNHIAVTNIQTLEVVYRKHPSNIDTGCNFSEKVESSTMIRFIRLTYVRPSNDDSSDISAFYSPPPSVSYKTFLPAPTKVGMCRGSPIYENLGSTCDRAKMWLRCIERRIIGVETFYHPLNCIWHKQDGCERTVLRGEWTTSGRSNRQHKRRRKLVHVVRVFLDGDYTEPPSYLLPPSPMVEEINDCSCNIS